MKTTIWNDNILDDLRGSKERQVEKALARRERKSARARRIHARRSTRRSVRRAA